MNKFKFFAMALFLVVACATPAWAQGGTQALIEFSGAFGAGLTTLGAAYGIGKLAAAAVESQARQPEAAGTIQITMIIAAALIEGFTFFAIYVCMNQA